MSNSTINLYDVLELPTNCSLREIKDAYIKLVKEFHPERPTGDRDMFELITYAYDTLSNANTRKEYDRVHDLNMKSSKGHFDLKDKSKEYYDLINDKPDDKKNKKKKEKAKQEYEKLFSQMDKKHGYDRNLTDTKITPEDVKTKLKDLELIREQDDIEHIHDKLFDDDNFDIKKFNAAFDHMHGSHTEMVPHTGNPFAYNDFLNGGTNYANFADADNYAELYNDDTSNITGSMFGPVMTNMSKTNISRNDLSGITPKPMPEYNKSIDELLRQRELETKTLENIKNNPDQVSFGGYGIFENIGIDVGNLSQYNDNDTKDLKDKYQKMLEFRKNMQK